MSTTVHAYIEVKIKTERGIYKRLSDMFTYEGDTILIPQGILTYPDRRAVSFTVYATDVIDPQNDTHWMYRTFQATESETGNIAYATVTYAPITGGRSEIPKGLIVTGTGADFDAEKYVLIAALQSGYSDKDYDGNFLWISEPYKFRYVLGRSTQTIGLDANDVIIGFGANARPISQGQYGQYPLYVFCSRGSIWALKVGTGDIAFESISPISVESHLVNSECILNLEDLIIYVSREGVQSIPRGDMEISYPIQNSDHPDDILKWIDEDTRIGYYVDNAGRREIWISTAKAGIYCFSLVMKRWFKIDGDRSALIWRKNLYGIIDGSLYKEAGSTFRMGKVEIAPMHMGESNVLKRFAYILLHQKDRLLHTGSDRVLSGRATQYEVKALLENVEEILLGIDVKYEFRSGHRPPVRTTEVSEGLNVSYGVQKF